MIDDEITDFSNTLWAVLDSGRVAHMICPRPVRKRIAKLLKLQRSVFRAIVEVVRGHCIKGVHARQIGVEYLANDFSSSCRDKEQEETVPHILGM